MKRAHKEIGKLPGTLVRCIRTTRVGLIVDVKDSGGPGGIYRYPEIVWFNQPEKIVSRGFETIEVYEDE